VAGIRDESRGASPSLSVAHLSLLAAARGSSKTAPGGISANVDSERKIHLLKKTINREFQEIERPLFELREDDRGEPIFLVWGRSRDAKKGGSFLLTLLFYSPFLVPKRGLSRMVVSS